jgi:hypothetical protein
MRLKRQWLPVVVVGVTLATALALGDPSAQVLRSVVSS